MIGLSLCVTNRPNHHSNQMGPEKQDYRNVPKLPEPQKPHSDKTYQMG